MDLPSFYFYLIYLKYLKSRFLRLFLVENQIDKNSNF